jgi:hypothetical protein
MRAAVQRLRPQVRNPILGIPHLVAPSSVSISGLLRFSRSDLAPNQPVQYTLFEYLTRSSVET